MWPESEVVSRAGLREGGAPWLLTFADGRQAVLNDRGPFDTEVAALRVAAEHDVPAPRVLGVDDRGLLMTVVDGTSRIGVTPPPGRLPALGAAAARIHAVELEPTEELPVRHRPIEGEDFAAWRAREGASPLLLAAEQAVTELPEPAHPTVLLHGDLWQGNTMWLDGELTGILDWDCAGVGHPGVDLGELRSEVSLMYGLAAAEAVLAGWEAAAGRPAPDVAYWDVVASLSTPPDVSAWLAVVADQGRVDLDGPTLNARRDEFLAAALSRL
jgi:aminoglycoside phosphotransferase (APT) family kinase protein